MPAAPAHVPTVGVITVTHNSGRFLDTYLRALEAQTTQPDRVVIVDSGSPDSSFLDQADSSSLPLDILRLQNVGFSKGNNLGWERIRAFDYVLFLNPDAFLAPDFIARAVAYMQANPKVGLVTPSLIRYDIATKTPLDMVDSTGVVRGRYGLIVERDQGLPVAALSKYTEPNVVPWVCAAAALGRREALESVLENGELFDESFFMYKEDTDLAWRIRRAGWLNIHHPALTGLHCRGWQSRKQMSRTVRLRAARNEASMYAKNHSPYVLIGTLKYLSVLLFDL
ncbi:glycosyltransferase family 2 protein [Acidipila sp. EB88]|uniref:glycosyltransferase family 2 protein n=1 Tax=Acidipila sp. EB88 TaxID=2305226 RepID=UPI000F5F7011|nr:glycosyltransferase family 2 protein [Acidipila sp. EB88]RRA47967.1 glycosyltransferase family 2 protein [Acidipila sp. EB88]